MNSDVHIMSSMYSLEKVILLFCSNCELFSRFSKVWPKRDAITVPYFCRSLHLANRNWMWRSSFN